ncbi:MAG: DUF721 domain-containing protein [Thermodesulfobacteriota bacterium]
MWRSPGRVGDILKSSFGRLGVNKRLNEYAISKAWDNIVGQEIARRTRPRRLIKKKLFVTVASSPWMSELMHLKENIRERINEQLGHNAVEDIAFRVGQVEKKSEIVQQKNVVRLISPQERQAIDETVSVVEDGDLSRLLAHVMEQQKVHDG